MASSGRREGGDRVLESRHLVGLFLGVVILCGVFFTLGYVMGRTQYGGSVHAEAPLRSSLPLAPTPAKTKEANPPAAVAGSDQGWDFYDKKSANNHLEPPPATNPNGKQSRNNSAQPGNQNQATNVSVPVSAKTVPASTKQLSPSGFLPPIMAKNSIVVQVAAVKLQRDALEMADAIEQKKLPAFVAMAPADKLYHVQIGPYPDMASAESAKRQLEQLGFKPIIKR
ncbi:MAG: SPOR domain-containing protein [Candidatus Acidiferrales bacterium]